MDAHGGARVAVSGLAFHSALAVDRVTTPREGRAIVVLVHLVPARAGISGRFTVDVPVPPDVDEVLFGNERQLLWKPGVGAVS